MQVVETLCSTAEADGASVPLIPPKISRVLKPTINL